MTSANPSRFTSPAVETETPIQAWAWLLSAIQSALAGVPMAPPLTPPAEPCHTNPLGTHLRIVGGSPRLLHRSLNLLLNVVLVDFEILQGMLHVLHRFT